MPAKNELKEYIADGYYHIYNRGTDKRPIFLDEMDYSVFLRILKDCLSPLPEQDPTVILVKRKNLYRHLDLLCFVLMPNHFHLFVRQTESNGIETFMRSVITRYVKYFNKKYQRQGHLFQGRYKAIRIDNESYFLYLSRYIHRNPIPDLCEDPSRYSYSSYAYYLGKKYAIWLNTSIILNFFANQQKGEFFMVSSYKDFVEATASVRDIPENIRFDE